MADSHVPHSAAVVAMVRDAQVDPRASASRLLQDCLGRLTEGREAEILIKRPPGRRPRARVDDRIVYLSVSHSADLAAVAVGPGPVGIDVERIREVREVNAVGAHIGPFMSWRDTAAWQSYLHHDALCAWTRYEAIVKALGVGRVFCPSEFACPSARKITFRGMDLPLTVTTGRFRKSGEENHAGYVVSVAARPGSHVLIDHCPELAYTAVSYER